MFKHPRIIFFIYIILLYIFRNVWGTNPYDGNPPFTFDIPEEIYGSSVTPDIWDQFFVFDLDNDGDIDYTFRSSSKLYVYDHDGTKLWDASISIPTGNGGAKYGAADLDGDGNIEIAALDNSGNVKIYNGSNGNLEDTIDLPTIGSGNKWGHIAVANLRGRGDRDVIIQTIDLSLKSGQKEYYINRSLLAWDLENDTEIWRVVQDDQGSNGNTLYEGYWGQAHGPFFCADVDGDGLDEVVGGNMIDHDGTEISLGYDRSWVGINLSKYIDHFDAISVGDFRPDLPGLEWIVTEEDMKGKTSWNTTLLRYNSGGSDIVWRKETSLFPDGKYREPQNVAVGDFDTNRSYKEVWIRSRSSGWDPEPYDSQHPWLFGYNGNQFNDYRTDEVLPDGFNTRPEYGNSQGLALIWTIDWTGGSKEYIAAKARHVKGNVGVFNALNGASVWYTPRDFNSVKCFLIYVADVGGDSREEVVICDSVSSGYKIRVYWNTQPTEDPSRPEKWDDPLYRRLKQNYNYYSPGSYTQRDPVLAKLKIFLEGPYDASKNKMKTTLKNNGYIPNTSPYVEDIRFVNPVPANVTDWILVQLRSNIDGHTVISRSAFIRNDGYIISEDGDTNINLFIQEGDYYVVVKHRSHLKVMSANPITLTSGSATLYNFTTGSNKYYGTGGCKELESGVWGMYSGDCNQDGNVTVADNNIIMNKRNNSGYKEGDINLDGDVSVADNNVCITNRNKGIQIP